LSGEENAVSTGETVQLISGRVPIHYKPDSFQVVKGMVRLTNRVSNKKVAARATFIMCEPEWTNIEPFYGRFETFKYFKLLKIK
jgi:hypothetical protein